MSFSLFACDAVRFESGNLFYVYYKIDYYSKNCEKKKKWTRKNITMQKARIIPAESSYKNGAKQFVRYWKLSMEEILSLLIRYCYFCRKEAMKFEYFLIHDLMIIFTITKRSPNLSAIRFCAFTFTFIFTFTFTCECSDEAGWDWENVRIHSIVWIFPFRYRIFLCWTQNSSVCTSHFPHFLHSLRNCCCLVRITTYL